MNSRKRLIAGNWKMHKTIDQSVDLAAEVADGLAELGGGVQAMVIPTSLAVGAVAQRLKGSPLMLGGQNIYWESQGAFTGEISAPMLAAAGATHVLVGHSERRQIFGESEKDCARKVKAAQAAGLIPILCIGETQDERESGQTRDVLSSQLAGSLAGVQTAAAQRLILAYEPVWAIGTGLTASNQQAQEAHAFIRAWMQAKFDISVADSCQILYGGSVKPANAAGLLNEPDVDGALVGGASLTSVDFLGIIKAAA